MSNQLLSFVVPCYYSGKTIGSVVEEISATINTKKDEFSYEIILVNDGSLDDTAETLASLAENNENIVVINLSRNFGQHAALLAGFGQAQGDIVITLDDDGQTPANEVFTLVDKINEGYDFVSASYPEKKHSLYRRLGSWVNQKTGEVFMEIPKNLKVTSYYACKRFLIDNAVKYTNPYPFVSGLLLQSAGKYTTVPVTHRKRTSGGSGYTLKKLLSLWSNGVTAFSVKPLRIASYLGMLTSFVGIAYGVYVVLRKIIHPSIPMGWSSTVSLLALIGGAILMVLGLIGEYVGRIYMCINHQPQYVVRDIQDNRETQNIEK